MTGEFEDVFQRIKERAVKKGMPPEKPPRRFKDFCLRGHPRTPENLNRWNQCIMCTRENAMRRKLR